MNSWEESACYPQSTFYPLSDGPSIQNHRITMTCHRSTDKRYSGDNRLIPPKSSYRRRCLAPRCRLITSWGCSRSQGYGCSPFKVVRELGSERRETVRSLSAVGVGDLRGSVLSTRGPGWTNLWCSGCHPSGTAGEPSSDGIN